MKSVAGAVACAFLIAPQAPAAAGPNAADAQKITACLEMSYEKNTSGVECIGIIADPCIAAASTRNSYIDDSKACATRELAIWNARITGHLAGVKRFGPASVTAVTAAQKSFSDSIAKLCPLYDKLDPGTALGGSAYCRLQETAMRALVLDRLDRSVTPH